MLRERLKNILSPREPFNILSHKSHEVEPPPIIHSKQLNINYLHIFVVNEVDIPMRIESHPQISEKGYCCLVKRVEGEMLVFGEVNLSYYGINLNGMPPSKAYGYLRPPKPSEYLSWGSMTIGLEEQEVLPSSLAFYKKSGTNE